MNSKTAELRAQWGQILKGFSRRGSLMAQAKEVGASALFEAAGSLQKTRAVLDDVEAALLSALVDVRNNRLILEANFGKPIGMANYSPAVGKAAEGLDNGLKS